MGSVRNTAQRDGLERGLGLKEAVALNMIEIVGIGPFVVSGAVIRAMGGPQALLAWYGRSWGRPCPERAGPMSFCVRLTGRAAGGA